MLKKAITYTNLFTDEKVTEEHYFHISKADLVEMQLEEHAATYIKDGETLTGMQAHLQKIMDTEDGRAVLKEFRQILRRAYGKKEGNKFVKSDAIWSEFDGTEAYSELVFELLTNGDELAKFINGVIPGDFEQVMAEVSAQAEKLEKQGDTPQRALGENGDGTDNVDPTGLTNPVTPQVLTQSQIRSMDPQDLQAGLADGRYKLS